MTREDWIQAQLQMNARMSTGALGRIILHNRQMNAAAQPQPPSPNAEPPRVTVQDIFDYHLLKDHCVYCQRPHHPCPVHNVHQ